MHVKARGVGRERERGEGEREGEGGREGERMRANGRQTQPPLPPTLSPHSLAQALCMLAEKKLAAKPDDSIEQSLVSHVVLGVGNEKGFVPV